MEHEILYRYLRGETTCEEERTLLEWLDAAPEEHRRELDALRYVCIAADFGIRPAGRRHRFTPMLRTLGRYAAGAAAVLLLLAGANYLGRRSTVDALASRTTCIEVPLGQRIRMTLADSTAVWLNAGSRLEYPVVFARDARRVRLTGEAMFEVRHDARQPFVVETFASVIEVLGTKFDVLADESRGRFSATLVQGHIKVTSALHPGEVFYLRSDEAIDLTNGYLRRRLLTDPDALCWTEGLINVKRPFDELMAEFERAYDVKIIIDRPDLPEVGYLSGQLRISDGIDHALRSLQYASDFTYERDPEQNVIVIR